MKFLNTILTVAILTTTINSEALAQQTFEWVNIEDTEDTDSFVTLPENMWFVNEPTFLCRARLSSEELFPGTLFVNYTDCVVPSPNVNVEGAPVFESFEVLKAQSSKWVPFQGEIPDRAIVAGNVRGQNLYACLNRFGYVGFYVEGNSGCQSIDSEGAIATTQIYQQFSILISD